MNDKTNKALKAAYRHFEQAANQHGDAPTAITMTAAGLHVLTSIIEDLHNEVTALRAEIKEVREEK